MSLLPRKENGRIDYKAMWEIKLLKGIAMFFVYLMFIVYVIVGAQSAWKWVQLRYYANDFTVDSYYTAAEKLSARQGNQLMLLRLIDIPPLAQTAELTEKLAPLTPDFHAAYFFAVANRFWHAGDTDRALFWTFLGRFRLRYDALRCEYANADEVSNLFLELYSYPALLEKMAALDEKTQVRYLAEVIEWDKAHPAENNPRYFCDFIEGVRQERNVNIVPKRRWPQIRMIMRAAATAHIEEVQGK